MDANEYLQPDFDPSTYKVAELRNVLLQNDVSYPTTAKKSELIKIFKEEIKPIASKKLKVLNSVVANDNGIEVVDKRKTHKKKQSTPEEDVDLTVSKKRSGKAKPISSEPTSPRKSLRKVSRSKTVEVGDAPSKRSKILDDVPDLKGTKAKLRERSPLRKSSSRISGRVRDKSPSKVTKPSTRRERHSRKRGVDEDLEGEDKKVSNESPKKNATKVKAIASATQDSTSHSESDAQDHSDSDIEEVSELEFNSTRKASSRLKSTETSFSNENVFQSPSVSPEFHKMVPRKRTAEPEERSTKKKSARSTTVLSSQTSTPRAKSRSPVKKELTQPKFEHDEDFEKDPFNFGDSKELTETLEQGHVIKTSPLKASELADFATPRAEFYERSSPIKQENSKSRKVPKFSKFKISDQFSNSLGLSSKIKKEHTEVSVESSSVHEDPELLDESVEALNDSELFDLQRDIDEAKSSILQEAEQAVKQINEIFNENDDFAAEHNDNVKDKVETKPTNNQKDRFTFAPIFDFLTQFFTFVGIVIIAIAALWYREQRIMIGYCGTEIDQPTFPNTNNEYLLQFDSFLQTMKPPCLECPENAFCLPNMKLKCKQDYTVHEPWYKLYGILPFEDYCVKDQEKENIINEILTKSLELLRTRNANYKCGDGEDSEVGITDEELYEFFFRSKKSSISDEEFDQLWVRVLRDLENEPEITLQRQGNNSPRPSADSISSDEDEKETTDFPEKIIFRSTSTIKLSVACKFQKEVYEKFQSHKKSIITFVLFALLVIFAYFKVKNFQKQLSKINEVSDIVIAKLQKQSKASITDSTGLTNRYLSSIQLRDELLTNLNKSNKFQLWDLILKKLDKNVNVRSSTKEIHGEIVKVLEWIGE